jgi:hypothetical protein
MTVIDVRREGINLRLDMHSSQYAYRPQPALVNRKRPHQSQVARRIGEDPQHPGASLDLLVEALEHVRRFQVAVMR